MSNLFPLCAHPSPVDLQIPIIVGQAQRSWPTHPEHARPVQYLPLAVALTRRYTHDAHFAAYATPAFPRRLSSPALSDAGRTRLPDGVPMILVIFDIDCEASHKASGGTGETPATDVWLIEELPKLDAFARVHADPFIYRTRGGYRLVMQLPEVYWLRHHADANAWSTQYVLWCAYLKRVFDILADPSCKDWTRLYRLPHATRTTRGVPEARETRGDPTRIGVWRYTPTDKDLRLALTLSRRPPTPRSRSPRGSLPPSVDAGEGVLFHAFQARGWLGQAMAPGKWAVVCPWEDLHTKGERFDTSTILFAPGDGDTLGWWHCSHAHCAHRDLGDVLALFTPDELARAREAAGLITHTTQGLRFSHARGGLRTVPAQEVLASRR